MDGVIRTVNETSMAIDHLRDHLRLLEEIFGRLDSGLAIDAEGLGPQIEKVARVPTPAACGDLPRQPLINACDGVALVRDPVSVSVDDLARVTRRAIDWCDAIRRALGEPIVPGELPTS
jgi:hypothetical protein